MLDDHIGNVLFFADFEFLFAQYQNAAQVICSNLIKSYEQHTLQRFYNLKNHLNRLNDND